MSISDIKNVAVLGAGAMGRQIALNTALYNYNVVLWSQSAGTRKLALDWSEEYLAGRIAKGRMTEERVTEIKSRFHIVDTLEEAVKDADLIIETIVEKENMKRDLLKKVSTLAKGDAIIASNSSFMPSSMFADCVTNPARLADLHYSNPVLVMKMAEVCSGEHTSKETVDTLMEFAEKTGKVPVWVRREIEGFLFNRLKRALDYEARWLVENGYCSCQDVDIVCETGWGFSKGPFRLNDMTGVDLAFFALQRAYERTGQKPPGYDMFEQMYKDGRWGRKTGKGFYEYPEISKTDY